MAMSHAATIVTIVDDDTENVAAVSSVREIADAYGVKVTFATIARNVEKDSGLASCLRDCQAAGHEIASHSYSHSPFVWSRQIRATNQTDRMEQDLVRAHAVLTNAGLRVSTFVYPYGNFKGQAYRSSIISMASSHYPIALNSRGGDNRKDSTHFQYVGRFPMRSHDNFTMVARFLRNASSNGDNWLVLLTHSGKSSFSAKDLESAIKICKSSGCIFATAGEAVKMLKERGWHSIPDSATTEKSTVDELIDFVEFHLIYVVAAILLLFTTIASFVFLAKFYSLINHRK